MVFIPNVGENGVYVFPVCFIAAKRLHFGHLVQYLFMKIMNGMTPNIIINNTNAANGKSSPSEPLLSAEIMDTP